MRQKNSLFHMATPVMSVAYVRMNPMERLPRDFKGVWIPREIWISEQLSLMEKVLFVEIHSLDNERGCFASNKHFADFFGVSDRQIRTYIGTLKAKGFISVVIRNRNERVMRAIGKYARVRDGDVRSLQQNRKALIHKWSISGSD
jgi:hypothetical protein